MIRALLLVGLLIAVVVADMKPALVQVAHRHGARTPIVSYNRSEICGDLGCGMLTIEGKEMLVKAGEWLRSKYQDFLGGPQYSPNTAYTRSTDLKRTIQSADGLLKGLYPDNASFFPVVNTVNFDTDELLLVDALPAFHIPQRLDHDATLTSLDSFVLGKDMLTRDILYEIGQEVYYEEECLPSDTKPGRAAGCALALQDIGAAFNAAGKFPELKTMSENYDKLNKVRFAYNAKQFPYNPKNAVDLQRGSLGQPIAQTIMQYMHDRSTGHFNDAIKLMEWSAHDTTMMPLCTAFGQQEMLLPLFGQMYVFELAFDSKDHKKWGIRAFYGAPEQTPGDHKYNMTTFPLTCTHANGTSYTLAKEDEYCSIDDLWRFVNSSKPKSPEGLCYLSDATKKALNCTTDAPKVGSLCWMYRTMCSPFSCPEKHFLNTSDYSCAKINIGTTDHHHTAVVAVLTALGGLLIGAVAGVGLPGLFKKKSGEDYSRID